MAKKLPTVTIYNNPELISQKSRPLTEQEIKSPEIQSFIEDMKKTLAESAEGNVIGVGLAAIQVGKPIRLLLAIIDYVGPEQSLTTKSKPKVFINPEIEFIDYTKPIDDEMCLSVPDKHADVARYNKIKLTYHDEKGHQHKIKLQGLGARVIQHEIDHLDGILFIDRAIDGTIKPFKNKK